MTANDVMAKIEGEGIRVIDLRFIDLPGLWQHFTVSAKEFAEDVFEEGIGFDGSSIRGFQEIQESDMLLVPDASSAFMDPFSAEPTLCLICNVKDPVTGEDYSRDPRHIAQKAENYLKSTGIGDTAYFGPEPEFFIFDDVRFGQGYNEGYYHIDAGEGFWNAGRVENPDGAGNSRNLGYKIRYKQGYFPVPPMDSHQDLRTEMLLALEALGVDIEVHHHEVGTAGQAEIDMRFDSLVNMGDKLLKYKYAVKNVARKHGKTVTLMPKPVFQDNGSGMHVHQSIWKNGRNQFFAAGTYGDLSETAVHYIGGILKHAPALLALTNPTTNSYRRLVPGYEAPINLIYSMRNRSAAVRIPVYSKSEKAKRVECRFPDPTCNGYLAFSAMLMAGLDGVQNKIMPPEPMDKDLYDLPPEELGKIESTPGDLSQVLDALEADHEFLLKGDVFTPDVIENWISYKRENEVDAIRLRPHPWEFALYFDI
ncbi:MAG: type I glutamate--ammonia ligase [Acidobacteria bacterium]|nr:type I glutamate--ammonia ligase [Acidobacteriota bacterium]MXZ70564.1 type I glutamate--ammonia ligase [Acidobacteriota bacterium]MYD71707.1 type I glutamate--ammonia ligase [Acidobacteriota bacterium]MYJ05919.1 type I glutamate--ammonia ligase [Acidobacteriota bacterium]